MSPRNQLSHHRSSVGRRHPAAARRIALATSGVLIAGVGMFVGVTSASAAVPTFPDNLLVFPNRDFVSVEGYSQYVGKTATLEVTRPGVGIVGSADATISGTDVAFEVNHPGGVCWGNGGKLKVTPDIVAGDKVSIRIGDNVLGETTVQNAFVTRSAEISGASGNILTVTGSIAPEVVQANTEQRIIAPDLRNTAINRRDIRALPGPMTPAPRGGYSSGMVFNDADHTFTATYEFTDPAWAVIARDSALGPRMMSWEAVDFAGNRQGVTIGEFGETGGPGFGGCPNGPLSSGPAAPTNVRAVPLATAGTAKLSWTPAVAVPGTPAITGYQVTAVSDASSNSETNVIGKRITSATSTGTTLTGLQGLGAYKIEVQSVSDPGLVTFPPVVVTTELPDTIAPEITIAPAERTFNSPQQVTLTSNEPNTDIYYTTNGADPADGDIVANGATHYTGPFTISETTRLRFVAIDLADNVSTGDTTFTITATPPATPKNVSAALVDGTSAKVSWNPGDTSATSFIVTSASDTTNAVVPAPVTVAAGQTTTTITGLTAGAAYTFTVTASNANGAGTASTATAPITATPPPPPPVVANAGPDQVITRTTAPFQTVTLRGTGSLPADATFKWTQVTTTSTNQADVMTLTTPADNPTDATFQLPVFKSPMTNTPLTFRLTVTSKTDSSKVESDTVVISYKTDTVQFATAKWKAGDFRITGGGSSLAGQITIRANTAGGPIVGAPFSLTAAVAPATGGTFDLRLRGAAAPTTAPRTLYLESTLGGTAGPFTVG